MVSHLISIITPCYNAAPYLRDTIASVLSQTYQNFEWLIINDGSTDESEYIIQCYSDNRIRYYKIENKGQCAASNFALNIAKGDYIKFFDADDIMNTSHLESQVKRINGRTDALASCAWGRFYDGNFKSAQFIPETVWEDLDSLTWIKKALSQQYDMMGAWLWLIPKTVLDKTGGWNESLSLNNDFEFSMRLLTNVKEVKFAGNAKLYYRSGNQSLSNRTTKETYKEAILSNDLGCSQLLAIENSDITRNLCANRYQEWQFRIYPEHLDLIFVLQKRIFDLGGSSIKMKGGRVQNILVFMFGWKLTKRFKHILSKKGYR